MFLAMKPTRSRLPTEDRQAEIVATVLRLAAARAPGEITTGDIAQALALTQGAVFRHFPTKEAIWLAAMDWVAQTLLAALEQAAAAAGNPLDALRGVFRAHVAFVQAWPGVPRLIFHQLQQPDDTPVKARVRQLLLGYRALVGRLLAQADAAGVLVPGLDRAAAAVLFIGSIQGLVMQSMLAGSQQAMGEQGERVLAMWLRAIRGVHETA